ncbi:hybrid-cluster NAD(P)-dependent oxidoreductase [Photobacterium angustum]|uniref:Hybrid-cluster NAD(P)-dependent oxidoreductase n=1 Tax=Photobacterium angustum TaxID=661 RepID=A0A855SDB6_PHOAN|nr:hybrid-cluster NAD(P)-dependent oxidoreductase [Photobacterium angustum]KJG41245.1 oxidoreductase [Photobacterium angustum]KJG49011.1 oxidoreductase [Photobacterium angustum]KJG53181.1 oxidoreductase [Photobacterium angustum]PSX07652.1 hybrid-cluster NAD(P)-dependent oxidoreductase [Photobacterium angustum]PSX15420.1 hybrid-cluster NAD(P)-dependent oxidoreductase [Photobacterium angustum]
MLASWTNTHPISLICIDKWQETDDTVSIKLATKNTTITFDFKPGQFVNLGVMINGKKEFRAYSISSIPHVSYLQLTIKRVDGGAVSNFIIDHLGIGDALDILTPTGNFNCVDHPPKNKKAVLISAGCGITPVYSMAKTWLTHDSKFDVTFIHAAKSPQQTIFFNQLEQLADKYPLFSLQLLLKDKQESNYAQGRLNKEWLLNLAPDLLERSVYLCGPNQFMEDVKSYLIELGFDMTQFNSESFTPNNNNETATTQDNDIQQDVTLSVPSFNKAIVVPKGSNVAATLEAQGLPLIVACRSGICGSCKCKATPNSTTSTSTETLTKEEIEQGYILACSSTIIVNAEVSFT